MSELCQMAPETLGQHHHLRGHGDAHRCCGKSSIGSALVYLDMRQHARADPISKRAPSALRTSTPNYHAVGRVAVRQPPECDAMLQPRQPTAIVRVECCTTTEGQTGVRIASRPAMPANHFVVSGLENGICGGSQPPLRLVVQDYGTAILFAMGPGSVREAL